MRVGILGSGLMGGKLGTLFARAGHRRARRGLQNVSHAG
jgi:prephenate dehydrogenase